MTKSLEAPVPRPRSRSEIANGTPPRHVFCPVRTAVIDRLRGPSGLITKIVALVAPVGYGKSVSMTMLFEDLVHSGMHCLWIGLDDRDTTVNHVVKRLAAAVRKPGATLHPTQALFSGQDTNQQGMESLLRRLERHPAPLVVFLDNLQYCRDPELHRLLDRLAYHTGPSIQVVVSSVQEIPLDISRARLQSLLTLLGPQDLSLDRAAVARLLGPELCERLHDSGVSDVTHLTEGWPAAVRMAQIFLSNSEHPRQALTTLAESDPVIGSLLNVHVLRGFPADVRAFLSEIALLHTFCVDLCRYVTGRADAAEHVAYLLHRNVFVISLDPQHLWYRFHGLFRDHLLRVAAAELPTERRHQILVRAAKWCESRGRPADAIDYALDAGCTSSANRVLEHSAVLFVRDRGDVQQYVQWLENLHARGVRAGHEAEYWFAWALAFNRQYEYARRQISLLSVRIRRSRSREIRPGARRDLQRQIAILRASVDSLTDHLETAWHGASGWLAGGTAERDDPFNLAAAHCIECCYLINAARYADARRSLQAARVAALRARSAYADGWVASYAALADCCEGNYASGYRDVRKALTLARSALGDEAGICGTIALFASRCAVGVGQFEDARRLLDFGLQGLRNHGFLEAAACGLEAALSLWDGGTGASITPEGLADFTSAYPARLEFMFLCMRIRRLLVLGRTKEASEMAIQLGMQRGNYSYRTRGIPFSAVAQVRSLFAVTRIELLMATGRPQLARKLLDVEYRSVKKLGDHGRLVELLLDSALLAQSTGRDRLAVREFTRAVQVAAPRSVMLPFVERAAKLLALLVDARNPSLGFISVLELDFFDSFKGHAQTMPGTLQQPGIASRRVQLAQATLTPREAELLSYIDLGLSNQQIADRIDASVATVKWHLQNLYTKLDVPSRSAAAARGRGMGLLAD